MMTVKQVATLTGISVRTLQFYDEIGLLIPTQVTEAGYRLYDENALETLQQILFFKELDFTLKEIKTIMDNPQFDKIGAFRKQRELIQMKHDRLGSLLRLLDKLIKGEKCMDFNDFDMSGYFQMLEEFKQAHPEKIAERFGSLQQFDNLVSEIKNHGDSAAGLAVKQYGSLENYTAAMKNNLEEFLSNGPLSQEEAKSQIAETEALTKRLTADLQKDPGSPEVQKILCELIAFTEKSSGSLDMGENYWAMMADNYLSHPVFIEANDRKYGKGAAQFIGLALKSYLETL